MAAVISPTVERGVPLGRYAIYVRYPFGEMEVGDSFFVEAHPDPIRRAACRYQNTHPTVRFTVRKVKENGKCGTRVWRVEA